MANKKRKRESNEKRNERRKRKKSKPSIQLDFPFTLEPVQVEAVQFLQKNESVMVSAHTSAGKTVVALHAIVMCLRKGLRVIYTSPIKTLCNRKYREFKENFSDVGLLGDVTIDPNASCLVMTTDILRRMEYEGSDVVREAAWIIFDDVHCMSSVLEETIVISPKNSRFVFLATTVPNAKEFADWVAKVHLQPCHFVYTDHRPTLLKHYIFPSGGDTSYLVRKQGKFKKKGFRKALDALTPANDDNEKKGEDSDIVKVVTRIVTPQGYPVICFSFSEGECDSLATQMAKVDLNDDVEEGYMKTIYWSCMDILSADEKKLPQVAKMYSLLKRGIGVYHSGLIPILKEVIEILFQKGLIKCLFATETFRIELNMPAQTVVFTDVRKFDGDKLRCITSGEYILMSGHAAQRGIDEQGFCILMVHEKLDRSTAKSMLEASADSLNSAFNWSYNMLLNQFRSEGGDPMDLLRNSFYQFQSDRLIERQEKVLESERNSIVIEEEETLEIFYSLLQEYKSLKKSIRALVFSPEYCLQFLQPGTFVSIQCSKNDESSPSFSIKDEITWGVIIKCEVIEAVSEDDANKKPANVSYTVDVLTRSKAYLDEVSKETIRILPLEEPGEAAVIPIPISQIDGLSSIPRLKIPEDMSPVKAREKTLKKACKVVAEHAKEGMPLLDPEDDMKVQSSSYKNLAQKIKEIESFFEKHETANSPLSKQKLNALHAKKELALRIKSIERTIRKSSPLVFKDEFEARKEVLKKLGYITSDGALKLKGRFACEISSADELTLTELIFSEVLKDIKVEEMISLLSCFVWQEKLQEAREPHRELDLLFTQLLDTAQKVAKVQLECKVQIDVEKFVSSFRPDIMGAVHAWATGLGFNEIRKMVRVSEGRLISAVIRLEEVLQQLIQATRSGGKLELQVKFEAAVTKIKRGIMIAQVKAAAAILRKNPVWECANGVTIERIKLGEENGMIASLGKKTTVQYTACLKDADEPFESKTIAFRLGLGMVIEGLDWSILGMQVGEERRLIIPPHMGHGDDGLSPFIPGGAYLVLDVKLVKVSDFFFQSREAEDL